MIYLFAVICKLNFDGWDSTYKIKSHLFLIKHRRHVQALSITAGHWLIINLLRVQYFLYSHQRHHMQKILFVVCLNLSRQWNDIFSVQTIHFFGDIRHFYNIQLYQNMFSLAIIQKNLMLLGLALTSFCDNGVRHKALDLIVL